MIGDIQNMIFQKYKDVKKEFACVEKNAERILKCESERRKNSMKKSEKI